MLTIARSLSTMLQLEKKLTGSVTIGPVAFRLELKTADLWQGLYCRPSPRVYGGMRRWDLWICPLRIGILVIHAWFWLEE